MKSKVLALIVFIALVHVVSAATFTATITEKNIVILADTQEPARYIVTITNNGPTDNFEIYSLTGVEIKPEGPTRINAGETKLIEIEAYPSKKWRDQTRGFFLAEYEIYAPNGGLVKDKLKMKIMDLKELFEVSSQNILPGDTQVVVKIQNLENYTIGTMPVKIKSPFFETTQTLSLQPYQSQSITIPIDSSMGRKVVAGIYSITVEGTYKDVQATMRGEIKYLEKEGLSVSESTEGIIVRKTSIEKKNEGNIPVTATVTKELDILSRLITSYAESPTSITKKGFYVTYVWNRDLQPSESLKVTTTTNYTLPLIILIIIVGIVVLVKFYNTHSLQLQKRVHAVKTKGGEFALKVSIHVKSRAAVKDITLTDRIPHAMKLYEKFGIQPHKIHESSVQWTIPHLNTGEERVFSYIIYSKLSMVGNFELPVAVAGFTHNGKPESVHSNKTSVMSGVAHNE